ncbi:MAG TPA: AMP-dependent synthetase/ligase [Solirubrobacterales bacterium]|nr:AMP-dependent synthetase/ligase [Solirubrobacterales bacterium]
MEVTTAERVTTEERYASGGEGRELSSQNLLEAFLKTVSKHGDEPALLTKDDTWATWNELRDRVARIAGGLASLGVSKGDTVAMLLNNRPEFVACDLGAMALGGVPFSIYQTASPEQIAYQANDAGAKVAITESSLLERLEQAREAGAEIEHVIVVDGDGGDQTLDQLMDVDPEFDLEPNASEIGPDDLLTLIYTSGTTGPPKGVQLTHRNLLSLVSGIEEMIPMPERGRVISWLPAAHIAERGANYYLPVVYGLSITVCPEPRKIIEFLPTVKPSWFFAVPRIWEKAKAAIEGQIASLPDEQREPAQKAIGAAIQKVRLEQAGQEVPEDLAKAVEQAEEQMFADIRARMGLDEAVSVNVGAAPTPPEVLEFFHAIGIPVGELWGMSETCGVVTCNPPGEVKLGTVGPPVPGMEVKLAEDGEVLVRGASNMPGYRNMPEATAETIDDNGWLVTGDIGELDEDGYLKIVDRKKELIINAAGKNMSPANIESKLKLIPLVDQAVAIGDQRKYNTALLTLDPDAARGWAKKRGVDEDLASLAENEDLLEEVEKGVNEANEELARVEQVKRYKVLPEAWEPGGDELTPTMKLKRKPIAEKYEEEIESLYE